MKDLNMHDSNIAETWLEPPQTLPRVADFFRGKDVFITGASGFLGSVLVEKLLRSAPDIGTIFMLLRNKRGKPAQDRIVDLSKGEVYRRVKSEQPHALSKLRAVEGDMSQPGLALSPEDTAVLQERVSVVFHAAATVRFDEPYRKAVFENVRGTREVCELARGMQRLEAFVHVSTAYCNSHQLDNEERLYPPPGDWKSHILAAETLDTFTVDVLTSKILGDSPNTYVFTKALAEHVVNDYAKELPISIIRPSIVCNSIEEPFPGWTDNFNGPFGFMVAGLTGVLHAYCKARDFDLIPVDITIKSTIVLAMKTSTMRKMDEVPIYNSTSYDVSLFDVEAMMHHIDFYPMLEMNRLYQPCFILVSTKFAFVSCFLLMTLPLMFIADKLTGGKKRLLKMCRTISVAHEKTWYFQKHKFLFPNNRCMALNDEIHPDDKSNLKISVKDINTTMYYIESFQYFITYFFNKNLKETFPWQDFVLLTVHFIVCGLLLLTIWKLHIISTTLRFMVGAARTILVI